MPEKKKALNLYTFKEKRMDVLKAIIFGGTIGLILRWVFQPLTPIPIKSKVVEIHMTANTKQEATESLSTYRQTLTMPLPRKGTCSGEFIDEKGDVLTAKHCVNGFNEFEVITSDQSVYKASVVKISQFHDLALLHISRSHTPYFKLANGVERGEKISILGSPLGITDTLSTGIVAKLDGDVTLLDCSALPGNSGGPVFNKYGHLVGMVNANFLVFFGVTHLSLAQSLDAIRLFLFYE